MEKDRDESSNANCSKSHSYVKSIDGALIEMDVLMESMDMAADKEVTSGRSGKLGSSTLGSGLRARDLSLCTPFWAFADAMTADNTMDESFMIKRCLGVFALGRAMSRAMMTISSAVQATFLVEKE